MNFSPQTRWGEQSTALLLVFCFFLIVARVVVAIQHPQPQPLFSNLPLDIPMLGAVITGILGGLAGLVAMIKYQDRSITVAVATLVGLIVLFLVLRQFVAPL